MKTKVLIVSTVGLIYDGITSVILSYLQAMERSDLDIYVAATIKTESSIRDKIEKLDCQVVDFPSRCSETMPYFISLTSFIKKNQIHIIHAHGNSGTLAIEMMVGWLGGCKKRIAHSHNTKCDQVKADKMLRPIFNLFYTDAMACGEAAGKWLFKERPFTILQNGRNVDLFSFNASIRKSMRDELQIKDELVIGHVGGFFEQKNHMFLVKIYKEILKQEPSAKLFMIGDGPLKKEIEAEATDILNQLVFTGTTSRVPDYLQALDGMLLPSLFEGLPLVAVEWQINGLPCIFSDAITKECVFTDTVQFLPLDTDPLSWATNIIEMVKRNKRKENSNAAVKRAREVGFDIEDGAKKLRAIYLDR